MTSIITINTPPLIHYQHPHHNTPYPQHDHQPPTITPNPPTTPLPPPPPISTNRQHPHHHHHPPTTPLASPTLRPGHYPCHQPHEQNISVLQHATASLQPGFRQGRCLNHSKTCCPHASLFPLYSCFGFGAKGPAHPLAPFLTALPLLDMATVILALKQ